ncbi:hypothetical protein KXD40_007077 [Peronospora effusa]|uniref:MalT-like TPR region domain-containing protein n=2 Tax=Peronospora TaxID=70742 RepID=A0A3R7W2H0_9STRA|nr:hypothetical protein DD237_006207 [Peronospora effusa]UIZ25132.1 hypothetical protein KXD40_007077 [Peronospora effusa]CAH0490013.1 unnamed protein product [Peronospora farinosa]CAI5708956.1 unnamed protein product [Peronospora farinosa]CAI5710800.1 unnamed protein product [Peronospora effusa]
MAARFSRPLLRRIGVKSTAGISSNFLVFRTLANATKSSNDVLKVDFKRWLKKEVVLLAFMVTAGATGVHFYQHRENAPVKQVEHLVKQAEQSVEEGDREQALKHCLHAYDVVKSINPHDRHLFELAFAIAAHYETLGRGTRATQYYLDALEHNLRETKAAKRERNCVVTLDRIAQSYENRGHTMTAERYYKQSISAYDQNRGRRELSKAPRSEVADLAALDREIAAVLYNYSQLLMTNKRWNEASDTLQRAMTLARKSSLSKEYVDLIEGAIASVKSNRATEKIDVDQK